MFRTRRPIPLAWRNLVHDPRKLAVTVGGIGFAVFLMFIEMGFKNALIDSTVEVVQRVNGELLLVNTARYALPSRARFDRQRLWQARQHPAVAGGYPVYFENLYSVLKKVDEKGFPIRVVAFNLNDPVFVSPDIERHVDALRAPQTAIIDTKSKRKYGLAPITERTVPQQTVELADKDIKLVGTFTMGTDFANDGNIVMSAANFARCFPYMNPGEDPLNQIDIGVIQLHPNSNLKAVQRELAALLPNDVHVYTKQEFIDQEKAFWNRSTRVGYIFSVGMVMGFVVGVIICYQIIYSDIADHMGEFATLKAMGYKNDYFVRLVIQQAIYLSLFGFIPGLIFSWGVYHLLASMTGLLLRLTFWRGLLVLVMTTTMCIAAGCFAMRKLVSADPADLF